MHPASRRVAVVLCALGLLPWAPQGLGTVRPATPFAIQIQRLSEPEGTFDTDNLISNERSYLDVVPTLIARRLTGGAYIGVGPDQNFSYIARIRPSVAYILDVRRDNLLLHLLFKALFAEAATRAEYLCLLTGRPPPRPVERWKHATIQEIVTYIDGTPWSANNLPGARLDRTIDAFGVPLAPADRDTIGRFHRAFMEAGLALRFNSHGRPPRLHYPTFRDLLLATDVTGRPWNYLASDADFQFVRSLQARHRIIPVVGDVSGPHALKAIADEIRQLGERVSAFYVSNVETYLARGRTLGRFAENLSSLPHDPRSIMIRSIFNGGPSLSVVQSMDEAIVVARLRSR